METPGAQAHARCLTRARRRPHQQARARRGRVTGVEGCHALEQVQPHVPAGRGGLRFCPNAVHRCGLRNLCAVMQICLV